MDRKSSLALHSMLIIVIVAAVIYIFHYFNIQFYILQFFDWLDVHGTWAPIVFILVDTLIVVFVLPGVIFTLGAGFLFGIVKGSLYIVIGTTIGATIAFLLARYLLTKRTARFFMNHPKLSLINEGLASEGWKIVLLTRLVPFFPFKLSNYFFGITSFSLRDFFFGTLIGIIPITMINVYIGSLASDLATLGSRGFDRTPIEWIMYGVGLAIAVIAVIYITRHARKILDRYISTDEQPIETKNR